MSRMMTVMMVGWVGLVGCTAPGPRPAPRDDTGAGTAQKRALISYTCSDGGTPMNTYALKAEPDGGVGDSAGCVIPGGAVTFNSECILAPAIFEASGRDVFANDAGSCIPSSGGSVTGGGDRYTITVGPGTTCKLVISPDIAKDADAGIDWNARSACGSFVPIRGTVEIATTDPNNCTGPDCRR